MNKTIIGAIVIVVIIGAFIGFRAMGSPQKAEVQPLGTGQQTEAGTIVIQSFSFSPESQTVKVGDTVTWKNNDSVGHSVTADDGSFDTGIISPGQSGNVPFNKAGTFTYHCSVHPTMKGTIVVQ